MKKFFSIVGAVLKLAFYVALLVGCISLMKTIIEFRSGVDDDIPTEEATSIVETDLTVTFDEIYKEYKSNELRADDSYKGNRYRITAEIKGMETGGLSNMTGGATLTMEIRVDNTIVYFIAEFEKDQEDALKHVSVGDTITFDGTCLSAGNWKNCEIVK